ncbi:tRNA (guanosine(37)-N1)-methyltransferase TrmD [Halobacteriovorax sp. XZX-3]|uniref:tRNA (guanosine(37)-N1)-methyltransferase TrmD n=1 Tax=unclassified Halobacteriovorax TaxID=2639665 RepID=UPI00371D7558
MKKVWVLTLFPQFFTAFKDSGVIGKFLGSEVEFNPLYLGDFSPKSFKGVDGAPYGGGPGMVIRADVLERGINHILETESLDKSQLEIIYTSPRGDVFNNEEAKLLAKDFQQNNKQYVFICGRYEGIDERFISQYVTKIISLGDYVLSGGELAVMTIVDAMMRFLPKALGNEDSAILDSFEDGLIEGPVYTRPSEFNGIKVPDVLLEGNHKLIDEFNQSKKLEYTKKYRPDLYKAYMRNKD